MKIDKKQYLEKINYIDEMLSNEDMLSKYISNVENSKFETPENINEIIKLKINNKKLDDKKKNSYKYLNILKVACFTLVVMVMWTVMINIPISKNSSENIANVEVENVEKENRIHTIYGKVNDFTSTFSNVLLSPIEFKGGKR